MNNLTEEESARVDTGIKRLREYGHNLQRPHVAYLRDKIYELRVHCRNNQIRILYFFYDGNKFILSHGFWKKSDRVRDSEIDKAINHREDYLARQKEKSG